MNSIFTRKPTRSYHYLKTHTGVWIEVELYLSTFAVTAKYDPPGPYSQYKWKLTKKQYNAWLDGILEETAHRRGCRPLSAPFGRAYGPMQGIPTAIPALLSDGLFTLKVYREGRRLFYRAMEVDELLDQRFREA